MPVRSKRLAAGTSAPVDVEKTVYTAPANETVLVKDIRVSAEGAVTRGALTAVSSGGQRCTLVDGPITATTARAQLSFVVLQPGDTLRVFSTGQPFFFWISGAELEGQAD